MTQLEYVLKTLENKFETLKSNTGLSEDFKAGIKYALDYAKIESKVSKTEREYVIKNWD